jgi:predicted naringenin-chalcone synthase
VTRHVLADYGNMMSATIFFMLDELRKQLAGEGKVSDREYGVLLGFGTGITMETTILRANKYNARGFTESEDDVWTI